MIYKTALPSHERVSDILRVKGLLDILVVFVPFVLVAGIGEWLGGDSALGPMVINLAYVLSIVLASLVLQARGTGWRQIGLARPVSWPRTVLLGVGVTVGTILAVVTLQAILLNLPDLQIQHSDQSQYNPLHHNLPLLLLMLVLSWTTIAFGEKMLFQAFLIDRLAGLFRHAKARWTLALLESSFAFRLIHYD